MSPAAALPAGTRLQGIQVLRAVAALLVLWTHLKFAMRQPLPDILDTACGAIGVDIFFVISGFVIAMNAARGISWRQFLADRVSRIAPLYYLLSLPFVARAFVRGELNGPMLWNTFAFLPLFDQPTLTPPVHPYGWTLSFEMWFYLAFAAVMTRVGGERARVVLPLLLLGGMVLCLLLPVTGWFFPRFAFHPLVLEFGAGCLLYHWRDRLGPRVLVTAAVLGTLALFWSVQHDELGWHLEMLSNPWLGLQRALLWGTFAVCLVTVVACIDLRFSWHWPQPLTLLGDASYSLYLLQPLTLALAARLVPALDAWTGIVFVLGTILLGLLTWRFVERPLTRALRQSARRQIATTRQPDSAPLREAP